MESDIARIKFMRESIGPDLALMVDANQVILCVWDSFVIVDTTSLLFLWFLL